MPSNDVELLTYRSLNELQTSVNLRLETSEDSPVQVNSRFTPGLSMISLSKTRVSVGDNVTVYWDIRGRNVLCGASDWIGLFELDGPMSLSNYLDYKQRGVTVAKRGAIKWAIKRDITLGEVEKKCIFKYIHASTGSVRAVSPTLYIHNPFAELTVPRSRQRSGFVISQDTLLEFSVAGLQANGLKKNIFGKPSPYVKLSIMPLRRHRRSWKQHHGQIAKTSSQSNTINPKWNSEEFVFLGGEDDLLEVEVRNKFSGTRPTLSRFLGKLSIPLVDLFEQGRNMPEEVTKRLGKRTPADRIQGTITLTITIILPRADATLSSQQENVPPSSSRNVATNASPQRSISSGCALSNLSLMSSAPNILQPLTLNNGNGFLETIFPVDTPSPVSPYGFMEQGSEENDSLAPNCRRQLHLRPFSEMYSGGFMPLDIGLLAQESFQSDEQSHVLEEETASAHDDVDGTLPTLQQSVEHDSTDAFAVQEVEEVTDVAGDDSGMPSESSQEHVGSSEGIPMEIPEENANTLDSGVAVLAPTGVRDEEMTSLNRGDRHSVASIELTTDSPLRILEESERVREDEIALSSENLLHDNAIESDDETEEMDISEASATDATEGAVGGSSLHPDPLVEDPMRNSPEFNSTTSPALDGSGSLTNQVMIDLAASEHSLNAPNGAGEEDLVGTGQSSLVVVQEPALLPHPLSSSPTEERERMESAASMELHEQPANASTSTLSVSEPSESTAQQLVGGEGETHSSPLEYVNHIVDDYSAGASRSLEFGNNSSVATPAESVRISDSSPAGSLDVAPNCLQSSIESDSNLGASEPVCLDVTSLQPTSATEISVGVQPPVDRTTSIGHRHVPLQRERDDEDPSPSRPSRVKQISRSSSEPRSTQSKTRGDRIPNLSSEAVAAASSSPRLSRSQLDRSSSVPQTRESVLAGTSGGVDVTSTEARTSAVESVVVAMPLLSPPQQTPSNSGSMSVVVADVLPEAMALVTPVPSPDIFSETTAATTNSQSTVFAVPLNPEENMTTRSGSLRFPDHAQESRDGYVLIVPSDCGQTSSAPSTLQRNDAIANAAPLASTASRTPSQHQNLSHGNSPVIYATPILGQGSESVAGNYSSFPRQSTTRVNPVSESRRRNSSSSSSSGAPSRFVSDSPSVSHRVNAAKPLSQSPARGDATRDARQVDDSRSGDNSVVSANDSLGGSFTLPVASTSAPQHSREQIQSMLKTYWFANSSQRPHNPSVRGQIATTSQGSTSSGDPERARKRPPLDSRVGNRRGSGRIQQGQPVHVSIRDQQQTEGQQAIQEQQNDEPLPPSWERGVDSHGRVYYIDHVNRTTTWNRPRRDVPESESNMNDMNTHWQSLDRRYESFRRTLRGRSSRHSRPPLPMPNRGESQTTGESSGNPEDEVFSPRSNGLPSSSASSAPGTSTPSPSSASPATPVNLSHAPAVKFLTRSDFIDFLNSKGLAGQYYFQSQMLKLIVSKIRSDPSQFDRYRHQVELVRFLNQFADSQMEMPPGWDKKVDQNGRLYFINHNSRTTTFIDPRLPVEENTLSRNRSETEPRQSRVPPPRPPPPRTPTRSSSLSGPSTNLTYNQQVVGFFSQPNIDDILKQKHQGYARNPTLKANVRRIQSEGERALTRLSNNLDFVMLLSVLEESIVSFVPPDASQSAERSSQPSSPIRESASAPVSRIGRTRPVPYEPSVKSFQAESSSSSSPAPYKRDFEAKVRSFHRQLYHNGYGQGPNKIKLSIRRDHILEDAFDQIMKEPARALKRNRLEIQFTGEEGLDYGGPAREFFFLLSRQLFNPYYGLFEYSANDTYTVQVSPVSLYVDNSHEWFSFCGRIIGLVIIHQHLLDAFFTRPFYKALLRSPCDLSDVEALDSLFHQSMTWVIENDITGALDLSFTVSEEIFGQVTERELVSGGKEIEVNERNKQEYVEHMVRWRVDRGVSEQMESIVNGFSQVLELNLISIFDARELELVISGTADIDIKDWRKNTEYRSGYHDNHKVVKWFWKAVTSFDNEQKLRLLQFVTGTSSIPYEGFAALRGSTGPRKFCIERWGESSKLPRAHTCFNRLDLPVYRSFDELLEKLTFAVEESETFSMQ